MKNLILKSAVFLFVFSLSMGTASSQKVKGNGKTIEKTREVGSFEGIAVAGSFDVFLVAGNEGELRVSIEENLEPYLVTEVKDGTLKIKWKSGTNIRTTNKTIITVHFKDIKALAMAGSGDIVGEDKIKGNELGLAVAGSGNIKIEVEVEKLKSAVSGSGDMKLSGTATKYESAVSGSGDIDALDLKTQTSDLRISGSGSIKCSIENEITARVSGSGKIKYKGNPEIEDIKVSGSGNVSTY